MASRINMLRRLCSKGLQSRKLYASVPLLTYAGCATDEIRSNNDGRKPLKLLGPKELTHEALIRQACTLTTNSSTQLLTQVLVAINDTSQKYREAMSELMGLLEESLLLITNSSSSSVLQEVEDLVVHQRNIVEEQRRLTLEFVSLMDYVEKLVTSAAETAFLAGAEPASTLMCERLNSALTKVVQESAANKQSEEELLRLQEAYIIKLAEINQIESGRENKPSSNKGDETNTQDVDTSIFVPVDIFENDQMDEIKSDERDGLHV